VGRFIATTDGEAKRLLENLIGGLQNLYKRGGTEPEVLTAIQEAYEAMTCEEISEEEAREILNG
jgi:hypothetical protein